MPKELAVFKFAPSRTSLVRSGPVQCIRNCPNCILNQIFDDDADAENVIAIKSYDDLVSRKSLWSPKYQTIQYHLGQIDVLKHSLRTIEPKLVIYVIAATRLKDIVYFKQVISHEKLPKASIHSGPDLDLNKFLLEPRTSQIIVPIRIISCYTNIESEPGLLGVDGLRNLLAPLTGVTDSARIGLQTVIVPVMISKDHDRAGLIGLGSVCIQIMQPYPLDEYLRNARAEDKTVHLVQHLYHDLSVYGSSLPCQVVALLLVYLDRPLGVSRDDLVDYMLWLKRSSMELSIHMSFTGQVEQIIDFALMVLKDFVHYDPIELVYRPKDTDALSQYASALIPNLAYYGIISKSILLLHNENETTSQQVRFTPECPIKVMKDDLIELAEDMAKEIDSLVPCRRPCIDFGTSVQNSFNSMVTFGKFFRVQEPRAKQARSGWLGDYDSDEEYFLSKRNDPAFKPWVILTQRPYRLDRLNLFMNVVEAYLEWIACQQEDSEEEIWTTDSRKLD